MGRFLKIVKATDLITDCVPIISSVKNAGILTYQLAHKVNKQNPVKTTFIDDLKINTLSKNRFMAAIAMIPIVGNLTCLVWYVMEATAKLREGFILGGSMGYLGEASRGWHYGTKKHGREIAALYLERNPNRSMKKMEKSLAFAAISSNEEVFNLILDSRSNWSKETIEDALINTNSLSRFKTLLTKEYSPKLQISMKKVFTERCALRSYSRSKEQNLLIFNHMVDSYSFDNQTLSKALTSLIESIDDETFLGEYTKKILSTIESEDNEEEEGANANLKLLLLEAVKNGKFQVFQILYEKDPTAFTENVDEVLEKSAKKFRLFKSIFLLCKDEIKEEELARLLIKQAEDPAYRFYDRHCRVEKLIASHYPDFPRKHLISALRNAGKASNQKLVKVFLNNFDCLKKKDNSSKVDLDSLQIDLNRLLKNLNKDFEKTLTYKVSSSDTATYLLIHSLIQGRINSLSELQTDSKDKPS